MTKFCICEVEQFFSKSFDGTMCKVRKVIQVFDTQEKANEALAIFDPMRYGDYDTSLRIIPSDQLDDTFR